MKNFLFTYCLLFTCPSIAATYYMRADGSAANKGAATSCSAAGTAMSTSKHNSETFSSGDIIVLCDEGGIFRGVLTCPSSGVTYGCETCGMPIVSGMLDVTAEVWTDEGGNIWSTAATTESNIAVFNVTQIGIGDDTPDSNYEWYWDSNKFYVYGEASPNGYYSKVEIGRYNYGIHTNNKDNITIQGITFTGQNPSSTGIQGGGVFVYELSDNITINNNKFIRIAGSGVRVWGGTNIIISNNDISEIYGTSQGDGITVTWRSTTETTPVGVYIYNNTISGNISRQGMAIVDVENLSIYNNKVSKNKNVGIDLEPQGSTNQGIDNAYVYNNTVIKTNGVFIEGVDDNDGIAVSGENSSNVNVYNNYIDMEHSNVGRGITANRISGVLIYQNQIVNAHNGICSTKYLGYSGNAIVYRNLIKKTSETASDSYGIRLSGQQAGELAYYNIISGPFDYCLVITEENTSGAVYNNTCNGYTDIGFYSGFYDNVTAIVKNNIFYSSTSPLNIRWKTSSGGSFTSDNNIFLLDGAAMFEFAGTAYDFAGYKSASGDDTNSAIGDPLFINASTYQLQVSSPAVGMGANVSLSYDFDGKSINNPPDIGAYKY